MIANLFVDRHSFECGETDVLKVKQMLKDFCDMVLFASKSNEESENNFYLNKSNFLNTVIFQDVTVGDLLYLSSDKVKRLIGFDVSALFTSAFKTFKRLKCDKPITRLPLPTKEKSYAICVMQKTQDFPSACQVIASIRDLGKFRCRHFIKYSDSDGYFDEADRYMRGLKLHPDIKNHYKKVFCTHKNKIDHCLWTMDEHYLSFQREYIGNRIRCVSDFAVHHNLYDGGSYEGSKKLKSKKLKFEDRTDEVYCEPHLKMNTDDAGRKGYCRIYFEEPGEDFKHVYVGYICEHK